MAEKIFFFCNNNNRRFVSCKSVAMKQFLTIALLLCSFAIFAQQNKVVIDANAKVRNISGTFSKLSVSSGVQLYLTQGSEVKLAISVSDEKHEERFKTEIVNGELKIYYENKGLTWSNDKNRKLTAWLSVKDLEEVKGSAGANVKVVDELSVPNFTMRFSSGAQFGGIIKTDRLFADVSSGSNISISGAANKLEVTANSGAAFKGSNLVTQYCTATANSGAAIKIEVQKELQASAKSGASIAYEGNAIVSKRTINSGGSVRKTN